MNHDYGYYRKRLLESRAFERLNFKVPKSDVTTLYRFTNENHPILQITQNDAKDINTSFHDFQIRAIAREIEIERLIKDEVWDTRDRLFLNEEWCSNIKHYRVGKTFRDYRVKILDNDVDEFFPSRLFGKQHNPLRPVLRMVWMSFTNYAKEQNGLRKIVYNWISMVTLQYYLMTRGQFLNCIGNSEQGIQDESYPSSIFALFTRWDVKNGTAFSKDWNIADIDKFTMKYDFSSLIYNILYTEAPKMDQWIHQDQLDYRKAHSNKINDNSPIVNLNFTSHSRGQSNEMQLWISTKLHLSFKNTLRQSRFALVPVKNYTEILNNAHTQTLNVTHQSNHQNSDKSTSQSHTKSNISRKRPFEKHQLSDEQLKNKYYKTREEDESAFAIVNNKSQCKSKQQKKQKNISVSTKGAKFISDDIHEHAKNSTYPQTKDYSFNYREPFINTANEFVVLHDKNTGIYCRYTCQIPFFFTHFYFTNLAPICSQSTVEHNQITPEALHNENLHALWNIARVADDKQHDDILKLIRSKTTKGFIETKLFRRSITQQLNPVRLRYAYVMLNHKPQNPLYRCLSYTNTEPEYCCRYMNDVTSTVLCQNVSSVKALHEIDCDVENCTICKCYLFFLRQVSFDDLEQIAPSLDSLSGFLHRDLVLLFWSLIIHLGSEQAAFVSLFKWYQQILGNLSDSQINLAIFATQQNESTGLLFFLYNHQHKITSAKNVTPVDFLHLLQESEQFHFETINASLQSAIEQVPQIDQCLESFLRYYREVDNFEVIPVSEQQNQFIANLGEEYVEIVQNYLNTFLSPHYIETESYSRLDKIIIGLNATCPKLHDVLHILVSQLHTKNVYDEILASHNQSDDATNTPNVLLQVIMYVYNHLDRLFNYSSQVEHYTKLQEYCQLAVIKNVGEIPMPVTLREQQKCVEMINGFSLQIKYSPEINLKILIENLVQSLFERNPFVEFNAIQIVAQIVFSATHIDHAKKLQQYMKDNQDYRRQPNFNNGLTLTMHDLEKNYKPFEKLHVDICKIIRDLISKQTTKTSIEHMILRT